MWNLDSDCAWFCSRRGSSEPAGAMHGALSSATRGLTLTLYETIMKVARASRAIAAPSERPLRRVGMEGGEESPNSAGQCAR